MEIQNTGMENSRKHRNMFSLKQLGVDSFMRLHDGDMMGKICLKI
jgi:hypothetical protein